MKLYLVLLLIILCTTSCKRSSNNIKYGLKFNKERIDIGLALLSSDWIVSCLNENQIWWDNPVIYNDSIALYISKVIQLKNDTIISETDIFINKNSLEVHGIIIKEKLYYTYYFIPYEEFTKGWTYLVEQNPENGKRGYISKHEADSILLSWGLSYP